MSGLDKRARMITLRSDICMRGSRPKWGTFFTAKLQAPPRRANRQRVRVNYEDEAYSQPLARIRWIAHTYRHTWTRPLQQLIDRKHDA